MSNSHCAVAALAAGAEHRGHIALKQKGIEANGLGSELDEQGAMSFRSAGVEQTRRRGG